jgi:predicted outer membrane protein
MMARATLVAAGLLAVAFAQAQKTASQPDFRGAVWGMTRAQVMAMEAAGRRG